MIKDLYKMLRRAVLRANGVLYHGIKTILFHKTLQRVHVCTDVTIDVMGEAEKL